MKWAKMNEKEKREKEDQEAVKEFNKEQIERNKIQEKIRRKERKAKGAK